MAITEDKLNSIIKGFISRLSNEIDISEVVLFGSYVTGNAMDHSYIDLAIISDSFLDQSHLKNMQFLSKIAANYNSLIEAIPFTLQEYKNLDKRTLLAGILKSGRRIPLDKTS